MCVCVFLSTSLSLGVYLSRYSDLLQVNPLTPGSAGEILIFKVLKVNQLINPIIITIIQYFTNC